MIHEIDLTGMVSDHADLERLCDRLEDVADALPRQPSTGTALGLCRELQHRLPIHEIRKRALFDALFESDPIPGPGGYVPTYPPP